MNLRNKFRIRLTIVMGAMTVLAMFATSPGLTAQPTADTPDWYYPQWLAEAAHTPAFKVRDTVNKYGRF